MNDYEKGKFISKILIKPNIAKILAFFIKNRVSYISDLSLVFNHSKNLIVIYLNSLSNLSVIRVVNPLKDTEAMKLIHLKGKYNPQTPVKQIKLYKLHENFIKEFEPYFNDILNEISGMIPPIEFKKIINFSRIETVKEQKEHNRRFAAEIRQKKEAIKETKVFKKFAVLIKGLQIKIMEDNLDYNGSKSLITAVINREKRHKCNKIVLEKLIEVRESWQRIDERGRWEDLKNSWRKS